MSRESLKSETFTTRIRVCSEPLNIVEEYEVPICFAWLLQFPPMGCGEDYGRVR